MMKVKSLWLGLVNSTIYNLIVGLPDVICKFPYCLVTCIDSSRDLRTLKSIESIIKDLNIHGAFLNGSLILKGELICKLEKSYNLFNGFDELWLFDKKPLEVKPVDLTITGPLEITHDRPKNLFEWMSTSGCILGLGDGTGLNYVTTEKSIARLLEDEYS